MWNYDQDYKNFTQREDTLSKDDFNFLQKELSSIIFYSKCLNGSSYYPVNDTNNLYGILNEYQPKNWYIPSTASNYIDASTPSNYPQPITEENNYDYYRRNNDEYSFTLKNLFTPQRSINESIKNYKIVRAATTKSLDNIYDEVVNRIIDGVKLNEGDEILVKDQKILTTIDSSVNPDDYFLGSWSIVEDFGATIQYETYSDENGIYVYENNQLIKSDIFIDYENIIRYSVYVSGGSDNYNKQFHLERLRNGFFPKFDGTEPIEFSNKKNWIIRNQIDYFNQFEIVYNDVIKHGSQSYNHLGRTYSVDETILSVGENGTILINKNDISNFVENKFKYQLNSIEESEKYYWVAGNKGLVLKILKHNLEITKVFNDIPKTINLKSISFFNNLQGVVVGNNNSIYITEDGGNNYNKIKISSFDSYNYNKVLYFSNKKIFIGGDNGVFIELRKNKEEWVVYRRRISEIINDDDEFILVDNINDMKYLKTSSWNSLSFENLSLIPKDDKELLILSTDDSKFIIYDLNDSLNPDQDFYYLKFSSEYGNINNFVIKDGNEIYFYAENLIDEVNGIYSIDLFNYTSIGINDSPRSNTFEVNTQPSPKDDINVNSMFNYNNNKLFISGYNSLVASSDYTTLDTFQNINSNFEDSLKSRLLFLDYDIAGKLNFFNDNFEYRLPEPITLPFVAANKDDEMYSLHFDCATYSPVGYDSMTQSENNWFAYWQSSKLTFEYYNEYDNYGGLVDETKILISPTFSKISATMSHPDSGVIIDRFNTAEIYPSDISNDFDDISRLVPNILDENDNRYLSKDFSININSTTQNPFTSILYLWDYLVIYRVDKYSFPVEKGDTIRLESDVINTNLIVNKIHEDAFDENDDIFVYMYSEFNQSIIKKLLETTENVLITNLNTFLDGVDDFNDAEPHEQLENNFNKHDLSIAYELNATTDTLEIIPKFNQKTAYYNLQTNVIKTSDDNVEVYELRYKDSFLNFGYTPMYNILDYLEGLNDSNYKFSADKEYLAMPKYNGIPMSGVGNFQSDQIYIDVNNKTNKLIFGSDLKFEWESLFINTFVNVNLYHITTYDGTHYIETERMLIINKVYDENNNHYIIEFDKNLNFNLQSPLYYIDIHSRRTLYDISQDLKELNNIQRLEIQTESTEEYTQPSWSWKAKYSTYKNELKNKFNTDSYAKILLSDYDTRDELTGIVYTDYKNDLSLNIIDVAKENQIDIKDTTDNSGYLQIETYEKHNLVENQGVNLIFNGGSNTSETLNPEYFGYKIVRSIIDDYKFVVAQIYGDSTTEPDTGIVKWMEKDNFLNYQPIDLIEVKTDLKQTVPIELSPSMTKIEKNQHFLTDVDYTNYRFKITDDLLFTDILKDYPWFLEAEVSNAIVGRRDGEFIWYKGVWECGRWFEGSWYSGVWINGNFYGGNWYSKKITKDLNKYKIHNDQSDITFSKWYGGNFYDGYWYNGTWYIGDWYNGAWVNGYWVDGTWHNGTWHNGLFTGGIWVNGEWMNGVFNSDNGPSYWFNGNFYGGDFENGIWYDGVFSQKNSESRFGIKSHNSRRAIWKSGLWLNGHFFSQLNTDNNNKYKRSKNHKYSIWETGKWLNGDFWGGVVFNIDFRFGTWHGGVVEEIQIIGFKNDPTTNENYFILDGRYEFNIGDEFTVIDNNLGVTYSNLGSNDNPKTYKVLKTKFENKKTYVYVDYVFNNSVSSSDQLGLRIVSRFENYNWKSGVLKNGILGKGSWEGGIFYNGIFKGTWM